MIVDNFPLIYELLDECMDFGVIQLTDYNILKEYIKMEVNLGTLPSLHPISDSWIWYGTRNQQEIRQVRKEEEIEKERSQINA